MPSLGFNGTTQFASGATVVTATPVTLSIWSFQTSDPGVASTAFGIFNNAGVNSRFALAIATSTLVLAAGCSDASTNSPATTSNAASLNVWNHLCGVFTSATARAALVNGSIAGKGTSVTSRTPVSLAAVSMGVKNNSVQSLWFPGQLANASIWNSALSDDEVVALAAGVSPFKIQPHKLVFFAPYVGVGSVVQDWKGNNLTITGATTNANTPPKVGHP